MKLHRYLGCVYDLYFEEVNIRFLVHKALIDEETRNLLLFYVITGHVPDGIRVEAENNVLRFAPDDEDVDFSSDSEDYLWFAL
ncbi:MAG: hypothetical protein ACOX4J_06100 [Anaerovoracaceae bacterium]|jgi:hypothetical protein